jgi:hypothetical protein
VRWDENQIFLERDKLEVARLGADQPAGAAAAGSGTAPTYFPDDWNGVAIRVIPLLKRRCDRCDAVTLADLGAIMH